MTNFEIIPYTEINGIRTFTDTDILDIYDRIIDKGNGYIFNDGTIANRNKFLEVMKSNGFLYIVYYKTNIVLIVWINRFEGKIARIHWCSFNGISCRKKIDAGKYVCEKLLTMKNDNGEYVLDLLIGYMPISNIVAIKFSKACGCIIGEKIPNLIWNAKTKKSESGIIGYYHRGLL
jgi:hypothetical protein